jgi:hypothetical protein
MAREWRTSEVLIVRRHTDAQSAMILQTTKIAVKRFRHRNGIRTNYFWTDEQVRIGMELCRAGVKTKQAAEIIGRPHSTVQSYFRKWRNDGEV